MLAFNPHMVDRLAQHRSQAVLREAEQNRLIRQARLQRRALRRAQARKRRAQRREAISRRADHPQQTWQEKDPGWTILMTLKLKDLFFSIARPQS